MHLIQRPAAELAALHTTPAQRFPGGTVAQAAAWLADLSDAPASFDLEIAFSDQPAAGESLRLTWQTDDGEQTVLDCDLAAGCLRVDRRRSGHVDFHSGFGGVYTAPLRLGAAGH